MALPEAQESTAPMAAMAETAKKGKVRVPVVEARERLVPAAAEPMEEALAPVAMQPTAGQMVQPAGTMVGAAVPGQAEAMTAMTMVPMAALVQASEMVQTGPVEWAGESKGAFGLQTRVTAELRASMDGVAAEAAEGPEGHHAQIATSSALTLIPSGQPAPATPTEAAEAVVEVAAAAAVAAAVAVEGPEGLSESSCSMQTPRFETV